MALETLKSPELPKDALGEFKKEGKELKNQVEEENMKKVWLILDDLNAPKADATTNKEIMKSLVWKTNEFTNIYAKRLAKSLEGKGSWSQEELAFDEYRTKQNLAEETSMKKEFKAMTSEDKANVLFAAFWEELISLVKWWKDEEYTRQHAEATASDGNNDIMYKKYFMKMSDAWVKINESLKKAE